MSDFNHLLEKNSKISLKIQKKTHTHTDTNFL